MGMNRFINFHKIYKYDKYDTSNNFRNFLIQFDLFGTTYIPSLFHHYEQKTIYGALLTFILYSIILAKIIIICCHIYSKDLYTVKVTTYNDNDIFTNISNFSISICSDESFSIENNVKYNPFKQNNNNITNHTSTPIIRTEFDKDECLYYDLSNLTLKDSDLPDNLIYASTVIKIIENNTPSFFNIKFAIPLIYPSIKNYYNPLQKRIKLIYFPEATHGKTLRIYLSKLQINYKNSLLFNLFHSEQIENYTVFEDYELLDNLGILSYYGMSFIEIYYTGWTTQYSFVGYNLDYEISNFGGFINIFYFIFNFIGRIINSIIIIQSININLTKRRSIHFSFKKNNYNYNLSTVSNYNIKKNFDTVNLKNVTFRNNKSFKNNFLDKKSVIQSQNDINISSTHNNLLNENNFNFRFIENSEQVSKFETRQFQKILDYGYIYQSMKDIILLILLSLNTEKAKIFFDKRKKCLNILRLEKEMHNLSHSQNINVFDKLKDKIELINKNIFTSHLNFENKETMYYDN